MKRKPMPAPPAAGPEHTDDCVEARGGPDCWPTVWELAQRAGPTGALADVLTISFIRAIDFCPHPAHESYRLMYRRPAPGVPTDDRAPVGDRPAAEVPA